VEKKGKEEDGGWKGVKKKKKENEGKRIMIGPERRTPMLGHAPGLE